ncbi:MAG: prepilin-type N-terminal cleavage/methylation domain-containing protein [Candidatus Ozemobacteraceae bacterium]
MATFHQSKQTTSFSNNDTAGQSTNYDPRISRILPISRISLIDGDLHTEKSVHREHGRERTFLEGFTMVEMMVALIIFAMISLAMYNVLSAGNRAGMKAYTRQDMTQDANNLVKLMQIDFAVAASASLNIKSDASEIKLEEHHKDKMQKVTYIWNKPKLYRKVEESGVPSSLHILSNNLSTFSIEKKPRPSGPGGDTGDTTAEQVLIKIGLVARVPGSTQEIVHEQHAMATMREVTSLKYDPNWRDVGNLKGCFNSYGNLLQSIGEDCKALVEDVSKTVDDAIKNAEDQVKDALNKPKENLEATKNQLKGALKEIAQGKIDVGQGLKDIEENLRNLPSNIFERKLSKPGTWFASKDDALKRVQNTFNTMKNPGEMDYKKLEDAADPFKLNEAFKGMFDSKRDSLVQNIKLGEQEKKVGDLIKKIDEQGFDGARD